MDASDHISAFNIDKRAGSFSNAILCYCARITANQCAHVIADRGVTRRISHGGFDAVLAFAQRCFSIDSISTVLDGRCDGLRIAFAISDDQGDGAAILGIGGTDDGRRGIRGQCRCIDSQRRCGQIDLAHVIADRGVTRRISHGGFDAVLAFAQRCFSIDSISTVLDGRCDGLRIAFAVGDDQRNGAAISGIGGADKGRCGVRGQCRCIDRK